MTNPEYHCPALAFEAHQGFQPLKAQLRSCVGWLSSQTEQFVLANLLPCTLDSFRCITKAIAINLDALTNVEKCLAEVVNDPEVKALMVGTEVAPESPSVEAACSSAVELQGLIEFAILRVSQLVAPLELHRLPKGNPGDAEFESVYLPRTRLYCAVECLANSLQKTHAYLISPVHKLDLDEPTRRLRFWDAKAKYLEAEIKRIEAEIEEGQKFIHDSKTTVARLRDELANVHQTEFSGLKFSGDESMLPSDPEPSTPI